MNLSWRLSPKLPHPRLPMPFFVRGIILLFAMIYYLAFFMVWMVWLVIVATIKLKRKLFGPSKHRVTERNIREHLDIVR